MKATRLLLTLFLLSCGDLQGPRPQADLGIPTPPSVSLMACAPLLADSASATIGPAYTTDALEILELLPTLDNVTTQTVTGQLSHFSDYAIAW